jgi:hypothetical protein
MAAMKAAVETFSFNGEAVGQAGAAALRSIKNLAETAPAGRLFASIATLADTAGEAAQAFEAAGLATLRAETEAAHKATTQGMKLTKRLRQSLAAEVATPLPAFARG